MPTARERLLELSALPVGNPARLHITNTVSSIILIPEEGEIIDTEADVELINIDVKNEQMDQELIDVSIGETIEEFKLEDKVDGDTIQECC
jgi:hypothetical protein